MGFRWWVEGTMLPLLLLLLGYTQWSSTFKTEERKEGKKAGCLIKLSFLWHDAINSWHFDYLQCEGSRCQSWPWNLMKGYTYCCCCCCCWVIFWKLLWVAMAGHDTWESCIRNTVWRLIWVAMADYELCVFCIQNTVWKAWVAIAEHEIWLSYLSCIQSTMWSGLRWAMADHESWLSIYVAIQIH